MYKKMDVEKPPRDKNNGKHAAGGTRRITTQGPVANLEEHVNPEWWRQIFNSMYLKTDGDVVNDLNITRREVDLFTDILELLPDSRILDLCCGQGRHTMELARRGFRNAEGLDRSPYLVQKAKSTAKKEGLSLRFRQGDARKLPFVADTFDAVIIPGNSFGYFETASDDLRVLKEVFRVLKPWGKILIDVADGEHVRKNFQPRSWEWIDKKMFVCRERSLSADGRRLISREVITHVEKGVVQDQFYAERLYTEEDMSRLIADAGFSDSRFAGELITESERNQDLGMMEKRLLVAAVVKKDWSPVKQKLSGTATEVAVVMGDPCLRDALKPNCVFDDDDIYTIDQLKAALRELGDFRFTYINKHGALIQDLVKLKGRVDFVLNLCDEGYNNDPRKELHVPALLEMLDIHYTGGAPQCLAFCYDKSLTRGVAKEMDIPVPEAFLIEAVDSSFDLPFDFPVIVKPNFGDSSFGITQRSVCWNGEQLVNAVSEIRTKLGYDKPVLVEEFLTGSDITVGIIGNPGEPCTFLPITEEDYSDLPDGLPKICGYEAKWLPESPYWRIKTVLAELPEATTRMLEECCMKLFERLECRDYARFDWRLNACGEPRLLEVNPNPGWCWDGHLAKMSGFAGMSYPNLLEAILRAAEHRIKLGHGMPASVTVEQKTFQL
ncbi:MAG: methyltransferase domain-containing protein [bacterium]